MQTVSEAFKPLFIEKGDYFLKKGRSGNRFAFLKSGLLRIYDEQHGKEITQWISEPGYFITDIASFFFHVPARWNIQALSDCELFVIDELAYKELDERVPDWNRAKQLFLSKCFAMMEERIYSFISLSAEERYERFFAQNKELMRQVPLQYIASMLGMTPETLSRIRKKV